MTPCAGIARRALLTILTVVASAAVARADFPDRPIKIIVYTQPGGPIDETARRFAEIASRQSGATFVVENIPGASGLIAMEYLLDVRPDGYTLLACTKSNIAKAVVAERTNLIDAIDWIGLLLIDPECVITRRDSSLSGFEELLRHAREHPGEQIWFGPGSGTMDHLMAIRIWEAFGIRCRWVPYSSGAGAIAALLGGQGVAYVGNPSDAEPYEQLQVRVISRHARLDRLPDTPTFAELGHPELDQQFMWRGFALPAGCPSQVRRWYHELFQQVTDNPAWREPWEDDGMEVVCLLDDEVRAVVEGTRDEFTRYLPRLQVAPVKRGPMIELLSDGRTLAAIAVVHLFAALTVAVRGTRGWGQERLIPLAVLSLCVLLLSQTWTFPPALENAGVGAAGVPRLWLVGTIVCALLALMSPTCASTADRPVGHGTALVGFFLAIVLIQWWAAGFVGFFPSALVGTFASLWLLGERRLTALVGVPFGWLTCAYFLFSRLLHVDLPAGKWFS